MNTQIKRVSRHPALGRDELVRVGFQDWGLKVVIPQSFTRSP